jgi:hypothetical protein
MANEFEFFPYVVVVNQNRSVDQTDCRKGENEDQKVKPDQLEDASVPDENHFTQTM